MQISAANLLLAAQQPKAAEPSRAGQTPFASAMAGARAAPQKPLDLPSFDENETAVQPAPQTAAAASQPAAKPYGGAGGLGRTLDIRV